MAWHGLAISVGPAASIAAQREAYWKHGLLLEEDSVQRLCYRMQLSKHRDERGPDILFCG